MRSPAVRAAVWVAPRGSTGVHRLLGESAEIIDFQSSYEGHPETSLHSNKLKNCQTNVITRFGMGVRSCLQIFSAKARLMLALDGSKVRLIIMQLDVEIHGEGGPPPQISSQMFKQGKTLSKVWTVVLETF